MVGFREICRRLSFDSFEEIRTGFVGAPVERRGRMGILSVPKFLTEEFGTQPIDVATISYLKDKVKGYDLVVDLFCPAWVYEIGRLGRNLPILKSRIEIYYESAGGTGKAIKPGWHFLKEDWWKFNLNIKPSLPSKYVVLHTRATDHRRTWDAKYVKKLVETFPDVHFIEIDCYRRNTFSAKNYLFLGHLDIGLSACLISNATCVICVDSGIFHLAGAIGNAPIIALYGPTFPVLANHYACTVLTVDNCFPCHVTKFERCDSRAICKRLMEVTPEMVANELRRYV